MSKFDQIFAFKHGGNPYMLLRVMNYGKDTDELKFTFLDKRFQRSVIYNEESYKFKKDDVFTDYNEVTYHSDGSVLLKHPRYPVDSKKYINPKKEGYRRRKLSEIHDWEPLIKYDVFDYQPCKVDKKYIQEKKEKIFTIDNKIIFNGQPFSCLINLVHKNYKLPNINHPTEEILKVQGLTENLELFLIIAKISKQGNQVETDQSNKKIFSTNNIARIIEKNA